MNRSAHSLLMLMAVVFSVLSVLTGCAHWPQRAQPASAHYVLLHADQTALHSVTNDADNTIVKFRIVVPDTMQFFDSDGRVLKPVREGRLAWLPGLHQGILVKLDDAKSFIAVRAGARLTNGPRAAQTPQLIRLRDKVVALGPANDSMRRALAAIASPQASDDAGAVPNPGPPTDKPAGEHAGAYIAFEADSMRLMHGNEQIQTIAAQRQSARGVLLISGITGPNAPATHVDLARARARVVRSLLVGAGLPIDKTIVTAVFRTHAHARNDPWRPLQTVGLAWLPDKPERTKR